MNDKPFHDTPAIEDVRQPIRDLPVSLIREVSDLGIGKPGVIPLWFGESDITTPEFICDAAKNALDEGDTFYQPNAGIDPLRESLAAYMNRLYGTALTPAHVTITVSGMNAVMIAMQAIVGAGDHLVSAEPSWPNLTATARILGAEVTNIDQTPHPEGWQLDLDRLFDACGPKTRAILINSPANPSGWMMEPEAQRAVLDFARERGLWIVADEVYARVVYDRPVAPSFLEVAEDEDRVIVINSFSKSWAMTGWRLGWITAPPSIGTIIEKLIEFNIACPPGFIQQAGVTAIEDGEDFIKETVAGYRDSRDLVVARLGQLSRVMLPYPRAAFYAFFSVDGMDDGFALCRQVLEETGVGMAPGEAFGDVGKGFIRLCFATRPRLLDEALGKLEPYLR
jgi:aspartate/methionine/tyrosine aminotransferase